MKPAEENPAFYYFYTYILQEKYHDRLDRDGLNIYSGRNSSYRDRNRCRTNTTDTIYLYLFPSDYYIWGFLLVALLLEGFLREGVHDKITLFYYLYIGNSCGLCIRIKCITDRLLRVLYMYHSHRRVVMTAKYGFNQSAGKNA